MRYIMFVIFILVSTKSYKTQENAWQIVEQCLEEPVEAPINWSFDGFVAYYNNDGIHAIRSNLETPYFLAFSRPGQFIQFASFSPDGRWLRVAAGRQGWRNWAEDWYWIDEFRIYSTGLDRELVYRIPWDFVFSASRLPYYYRQADWVGNDFFYHIQGNDYDWDLVRYDLSTQTYEIILDDTIVEATEEIQGNRNQLVFTGINYEGVYGVSEVYELEDGRLNFHPSPNFYTYNANLELEIHHFDGTVVTIIEASLLKIFAGYFASPNGRYLAFSASPNLAATIYDATIYILDIDAQLITNTCIPTFSETLILSYAFPLAWSPDSTMLTFANPSVQTGESESRLLVFDLEAYKLYYTHYFSGQIMGWYQGY